MSGELRTSQFRWTTTADDDFVIGNPDPTIVLTHPTKALVFQSSSLPGYINNPSLLCKYNSGTSAWEFKLSADGGTTDSIISGIAYLAGTGPQTFTGNNAFTESLALIYPNGRILFGTGGAHGSISAAGDGAFNSLNVNNLFSVNTVGNVVAADLRVNGNLDVKGTTTTIESTVTTIVDPLITLNKGGSGVVDLGIEVEVGGNITGYWKTSVAGAGAGWIMKAPASLGTITINPKATAGNVDLNAGNSGTIMVSSDLAGYVATTGNQSVGGIKTFTSLSQFQGGANFGTSAQASISTTGVASFVTISGGNFLGSLAGHAVPADATGSTGNLLTILAGGALGWAAPSTAAVAGVLLTDTVTGSVYKVQMTNGVLTTVLQ